MSADGVWKTTVHAPLGVQEGRLTIHTEGGGFTGEYAGRYGSHLVTGQVHGDRLIWTSKIVLPFPITLDFDVRVTGDVMEGSVSGGPNVGATPFRGVRA